MEAPSPITRRRSRSAGTVLAIAARTLPVGDEDGDGVSLRLEDDLGHVADVLAVELERHRPVAADLDAVAVAQQHQRQAGPAGEEIAERTRQASPAQRPGREQVETAFDPSAARQP